MIGAGINSVDDETGSWASSAATRKSMQGNRRRDTAPELRLRSALHRLGLRFRVDRRPLLDLNRRADVVFSGATVAVFVHGCFWHGCPEHASKPKRNSGFWLSKIERNQERDQETHRLLFEAGWLPITVWEHEDPILAARKIDKVVRQRRSLGGRVSVDREPI